MKTEIQQRFSPKQGENPYALVFSAMFSSDHAKNFQIWYYILKDYLKTHTIALSHSVSVFISSPVCLYISRFLRFLYEKY